MTSKQFSALARRLMSCPTAPYYEAGVRAEVERVCAERGLAWKRDRFGNVIVSLQTAPRQRPLVLAAHMDHPGFEVVGGLRPNRWLARFHGGVPDRYFRPGVAVRLIPGNAPARLGRRRYDTGEFELLGTRPLQAGAPTPKFAVWELEDFTVRNERIHGRACDDLVGVASVLATMIDLKRSRARVHVMGVISRAEEVGFQGALALAHARTLPANAVVVSLETSKELPPARMGDGVVLRVGDRSSVFDSEAMRFLTEVAGEVQQRDGAFRFQRALMFGGTCEATAYQESGYRCGAVCVPLGNYHNCGPGHRIAAEYVSLNDACSMVRLLAEAAWWMPAYDALTGRLTTRLRSCLKTARVRLKAKQPS